MMLSNYNPSIIKRGYPTKRHQETKQVWKTSYPVSGLYYIGETSIQKTIKHDSVNIGLETRNISIPYAISQLKRVVDDSRHIVELKDDWDDEDATSYSVDIWENAVEFVVKIHLEAFKLFNLELDYPEIYPGPGGSIDIMWEKDSYEILANFPNKNGEDITFYGEDADGASFKGSFKVGNTCSSLMMILIGKKKCGK